MLKIRSFAPVWAKVKLPKKTKRQQAIACLNIETLRIELTVFKCTFFFCILFFFYKERGHLFRFWDKLVRRILKLVKRKKHLFQSAFLLTIINCILMFHKRNCLRTVFLKKSNKVMPIFKVVNCNWLIDSQRSFFHTCTCYRVNRIRYFFIGFYF